MWATTSLQPLVRQQPGKRAAPALYTQHGSVRTMPHMELHPTKLIPLSAMARRLGIQPKCLRAEIESGRVPAVRVGDGWLVDPTAVEAVLLERARQAPTGGRAA